MAEKLRMATVELEWPLVDLDPPVTSITLRRLTGAEVASLQAAMMGDGASDEGMIAAFADQPAEVIGQLDADDFMELKDRVVDFLPRRIRAALEQVAAEEIAKLQPADQMAADA